MGDASASLDTFHRLYGGLSSLGDLMKEVIRKQPAGLEATYHLYVMHTETFSLSVKPPAHKHTAVISGLPKPQPLSGEER